MQEELLSKEYGNGYVFRRTVKCSLQVRKCSSSQSVRFLKLKKKDLQRNYMDIQIALYCSLQSLCGKILGPINVKKVFEVKCLSEFTKPKEYRSRFTHFLKILHKFS